MTATKIEAPERQSDAELAKAMHHYAETFAISDELDSLLHEGASRLASVASLREELLSLILVGNNNGSSYVAGWNGAISEIETRFQSRANLATAPGAVEGELREALEAITRKMPKVTSPISFSEPEKVKAWVQGVNDCADYYVSVALHAIAKAESRAASAPIRAESEGESVTDELLAAAKLAVYRPEKWTPALLMELSAKSRDALHAAIARAEASRAQEPERLPQEGARDRLAKLERVYEAAKVLATHSKNCPSTWRDTPCTCDADALIKAIGEIDG